MAVVNHYGTKVEMTVSLTLPEEQARALKWLADCGADALWKFVETNYGSQASRHKDAMKELVSDLRAGLGQTLARADRAREAFKPEQPKPV
jgi:hypothetical protein